MNLHENNKNSSTSSNKPEQKIKPLLCRKQDRNFSHVGTFVTEFVIIFSMQQVCCNFFFLLYFRVLDSSFQFYEFSHTFRQKCGNNKDINDCLQL